MRYPKACALTAVVLWATAGAAETVTVESLLSEMQDEVSVTRSVTNWTGRLWSSANPSGGNGDHGYWVSTRTKGDVTECVMVDATGPGAMTRLWIANPGTIKLRLYVDDDDNFAYEGLATDLASGTALADFPLAAKVSPNNGSNVGHNLYLPIPYASSFKLVAVCSPSAQLFYNAETRGYATGTAVEPFSTNVLKRAATAIAAADSALQVQYAPTAVASQSLDGTIAAGAALTRNFSGPAAVADLRLRVTGDDEPLRKVRVIMTFDGEKTVDVSLGQFFGCGYATGAFTQRHLSCTSDGLMRVTRVMPFASSATLTITNASDAAVTLSDAAVATTDFAWDAATSLHFGGYGFDETNVPAYAIGYDKRWVRLKGRGVLLGNHLSVDNTAADYSIVSGWWGEGDEKITVDGARTYLGTGTEDFFGYAYGPSTAFSTVHPFCALPVADNVTTGSRRLAVMNRERALDRIPFTNALDLVVEIWHWQTTTLGYAPATFWYMRPGGKFLTPAEAAAEDEALPEELSQETVAIPFWISRTNETGGVVTSVTLAWESLDVTGTVYRATGPTFGGETTNGWAHVEPVAVLDGTTTNAVIAVPSDWGDETLVQRFFLFGMLKPGSDAYAAGLYAQFDAIDNAGRGEHAATATNWVNLADRSHDLAYAGGSASFTARGFTAGTSHFAMAADTNWWVGLGNTYTWEACVTPLSGWTSIDESLSVMGNVSLTSGNNGFYFGQGSATRNGVLFGAAEANTARGELLLSADDITFGQPIRLSYVSTATSAALYVNGTRYASAKDSMPSLNESAAFWLGACYVANRLFPGTIHAARIYDAALSAEEIAYNAEVDRTRFSVDGRMRVKGATDALYAREMPPVLDGAVLEHVETNAAVFAVVLKSDGGSDAVSLYAVCDGTTNLVSSAIGTGTNTVTVSELVRGRDYAVAFFARNAAGDSAPTGTTRFSLEAAWTEVTNGRPLTIAERTTDADGHVTGLSVTIGEAGPKSHAGVLYAVYGDEIPAGVGTGGWARVEKVADIPVSLRSYDVTLLTDWFSQYAFAELVLITPVAIGSDAYAAGLYAQFDAIDNAGRGEHAALASTWANLADSSHNLTYAAGTATFEDGGFVAGSSYFAMAADTSWWSGQGNTFTWEAFVTPTSTWTSINNALSIMGNVSLQGGKNGVYFGQGNPKKEGALFGVAEGATARGEILVADDDIAFGQPIHFAFVSTSSGAAVYMNGALYEEAADTMPSLNESVAFWVGACYASTRLFPGMIHAVRIYDRALSATEIAGNRSIDVDRFTTIGGLRSSATPVLAADTSTPTIVLRAVSDIAARSAVVTFSVDGIAAGNGTLHAVCGGATNRVARRLSDGVGSFVLRGLSPSTDYSLRLFVRTDGAVSQPSAALAFTTSSEEAEDYGSGDRTVSIASTKVRASGTRVTVTVTAGAVGGTLVAAYGPTNGGNLTNGWAHVVQIAEIGTDAATVDWRLPASWGVTDFAVRFFLIAGDEIAVGYSACERIDFANGTYLDTGIVPSSHRIKLVYSTPDKQTGYTPLLTAGFSKLRWLEINNDSRSAMDERYDYLTSSCAERFTSSSTAYSSCDGRDIFVVHDSRVTVEYGVGDDYLAYVTTNGVRTVVGEGSGTSVARTGDRNLFVGRDETSAAQKFNGSVYSLDLWDSSGTAVASLQPAVRQSDSAAGFYDTVRKAFYVPTGTVTANGILSNVSSPALHWNYSFAWDALGSRVIVR